MIPSTHSLCLSILYPINKKRLRVSIVFLSIICGFIFTTFSEEVSFYIPEDHEKFQLIDSLYQLIDKTKKSVVEKEATFIKEEEVREDAWEIKKRYCNYLLENNIKDTAAVIGYYKIALNHYEIKKQYFKTLLSALEGDIRAKCFIFWKSSREEYAKIRGYIAELEIEKGNENQIQYDTAAPVDMTLDIKEPTVFDVLGLDNLSSENDDPFAGTETPLAEIERGESEPTDTLMAQGNREETTGNKLKGMALKKSDILADIETAPEPVNQKENGTAANSFEEDMLKALSDKKSANETDQKEENKETGPGSPEE